MYSIVGSDGKEYGPVTAAQIKQWTAENRLTRDMLAKPAGATEWQRLRDLPEFADLASPPPAPGAPPTSGEAATAGVAPASASPLAAAPGQPEPIVFTGEWTEYFKIWIVNVLLTIVTLGVDDLERAVRFYRDGLGWPTDGIIGTEFDHGAVAFFDLQPGLRLGLWPRASIAHDTGLPLAPH